MTHRQTTVQEPSAVQRYVVQCPDVVEVVVPGRPGCGGRQAVGPDGRIELGEAGAVRIDGQTPGEVSRTVGRHLGTKPREVQVRVVEFNSQHVYLFGEVVGLPRVLPYRGPETVVELLQRVGGITSGAELGDIQVVRANIAAGKAPEVFHVDLDAILLRNDQQTNILLQPSDQVYVGETGRCLLGKCLPPWFKPLYKKLLGLDRPDRRREPEAPPVPQHPRRGEPEVNRQNAR